MSELEIQQSPANSEFEALLDGQIVGVLRYVLDGGTAAFVATEVDPAFGGRGIGGALVKAGLDWARQEGVKVEPDCPFVAAWLERHPDYQDLAR